jgi:DNA-binding transcriptional LysR family regulator
MPDVWSLRILVTVAEHGSFSGAADALVLTQPAVSRQIARLERQVGVRLFRRVPRGVTLTPAGTVAVDLARDVLARVDAFEATMRSHAGLDGGQLRLAGTPSANTSLLPDTIRRFGAAHPGVTVSLRQVDPFAVLDAVRDVDVDLALVTEWQLVEDPWQARVDPEAPALAPDEIAGLDLVPVLDEQMLLALPADHPQAAAETVALAELRDETWVEGAHPDCLGPHHRLARAIGGPPRVGFTCDDWTGKQALVAGGAGVMVVPTLAASAMRAGIVLRPTTPQLEPRRLFVAVPERPYRTPQADAMVDLLVAAGSAWASVLPNEVTPRG